VISGFRTLLGYYSLREVPQERSSQYSDSLRAHEADHKRRLKDVCKEKSDVTNYNQMKKYLYECIALSSIVSSVADLEALDGHSCCTTICNMSYSSRMQTSAQSNPIPFQCASDTRVDLAYNRDERTAGTKLSCKLNLKLISVSTRVCWRG
jgi:hypothetical protein